MTASPRVPSPVLRVLGYRGLVGGAIVAAAVAVASVARPAAAADPTLDFAFFRERIEPVLQSVCAECHAGKGQGKFAVIARAPGVKIPEAESKTNFDVVSKLVAPGKPEKSPFLLKPLAVADGGVAHKGGDKIFKGTPAHRAWVDFINGGKGSPSAGASAPSAPGQPDFGYFVARVEPVLLGVCAQCHAAPGKGQFSLVVRAPGVRLTTADHRANFETVLRLLTPGKPERSPFLLKPLAERDGGAKHQGGDRISKGDANHTAWTEFINGVKGPPPPEDAAPEEALPAIGDQGLVLQVETGTIRGDATFSTVEGATGTAAVPGAGGGRVALRFRASRRSDYALMLRAGPGFRGARVRVNGGDPLDVPASPAGFTEVSPVVPLDGGRPLDGRAGKLTLEGEALAMDGREGTARFLSPADLAHTRVTAVVSVPGADETGRDDAWLLFDCLDHQNGKFFGLSDGGRRVVMGVVEGGRPRIVKSAAAPVVGGATPVRLTVDLVDGLAVGRVDDKPLVFVNFDRELGAARFGFQTHGLATVRELAASMRTDEVHRAKFSTGAVFSLTRGPHALEIELLPQGAPIDAVVVKEVAP